MCILYCENSGKYFADNAFKNNKKKTVTKTYDKENKKRKAINTWLSAGYLERMELNVLN